MPVTICNQTGDGVYDVFLDTDIELPDAAAGSVLVTGTIQSPGLAKCLLTGSPLTAPAVPGSGTLGWIIQADPATGAVSVKTLANGMPSPDPSTDGVHANSVIFQQTLSVTTTDLAAAPDSTPDTY